MMTGATSPGGDNHDIWIDPTNPNRMAVANDGGVSISTTRAATWSRVAPIAKAASRSSIGTARMASSDTELT